MNTFGTAILSTHEERGSMRGLIARKVSFCTVIENMTSRDTFTLPKSNEGGVEKRLWHSSING